jgi:hypothetical protein
MASVFYRRLRTEPRENIRARFGGDAKRALDYDIARLPYDRVKSGDVLP